MEILSTQSSLSIKFKSFRQAEFVKKALEVDDELQPHRVHKTFEVNEDVLVV